MLPVYPIDIRRSPGEIPAAVIDASSISLEVELAEQDISVSK